MDKSLARKWRSLDLVDVIPRLAVHARPDASYVPVRDLRSQRWHVSANGDFELLLTGPKFWDARAMIGGGGAVDLTMHIWRCSYRSALRRLLDLNL